ncbi:MAG TPA: diacylglycerol kinase family protein [Myxococcota bacterium]
MRIGLLNNLRAGRNKRLGERILREVEGAPDVMHFATPSAAAVPEAIERMRRADVELLIVNGGDGTLECALTALLATGRPSWLPVIAPIRGGRTNMTAADLGAVRDGAQGLREIVADARAGKLEARIASRAVLRVARQRSGEVRCGMFAAAGMLGRAVSLTTRHLPKGRLQETIGVALVTCTLVANILTGARGALMHPDEIGLAFDGKPLPDERRLVTLFTTLERLIFGFRPCWGAGEGPIRTTLVRGNAERLARTIPQILRGRAPAFATPEHGYTSARVSCASLRAGCEVTVDGELFPIEADAAYTITAEESVRFARA